MISFEKKKNQNREHDTTTLTQTIQYVYKI